MPRVLNVFCICQDFEYTRFLNSQCSKYASGSEYARVLNITQQTHDVVSMSGGCVHEVSYIV